MEKKISIGNKKTSHSSRVENTSSSSFVSANDPKYFVPPETGTFGRKMHDFLFPYVAECEHHVTNVQRFFGLPSRSEIINTDSTSSTVITSRYFGIDFIMRAASELGNELFYGLWAMFCAMHLDIELSQCLVMLWIGAMYIGQVLKDVCRLPRPGLLSSKSEVLRLDAHYAAEYGFPSTHTACSSSQPVALLYYFLTKYQTISTPSSHLAYYLAIGFSLFWFLLTPISRLYLGVHSSIDLIGGYIIGIGLVIPCIILQPYVHQFLGTIYGLIFVLLLLIIALTYYPKPKDHWTSSPGDTAIVFGAGSGILAGHACCLLFNTVPTTYRIIALPTTVYDLLTSIIQVPFGLAITYGVRHGIKKIVCLIARNIHAIISPPPAELEDIDLYIGKDNEKEKEKKEKEKNSKSKKLKYINHGQTRLYYEKLQEEYDLSRKYFVELCDKGTGYFTMSYLATFIFPMLVQYIGWTYSLPLSEEMV